MVAQKKKKRGGKLLRKAGTMPRDLTLVDQQIAANLLICRRYQKLNEKGKLTVVDHVAWQDFRSKVKDLEDQRTHLLHSGGPRTSPH